MSKTLLFLLFFSVASSAQENTIDYIAYSDNTYYEILKHKKNVTVVKYYLNESRLKQDTLDFTSLEETKNKLHFETLLKAKRLGKDWHHNKHVSLNFKTDTLYAFQFHKNGNKELWYLSGDENLEVYDRFWCKPKAQPSFIPIKNKQFEVILIVRDDMLSLVYYDKKKGIQGDIRF